MAINVERKAGLNKGVRRVWLEGKELADAGFVRHARYDVVFLQPAGISLTLNPNGKRAVSGKQKADGSWHPIIDITGAKVADSILDSERINVRFSAGVILVTPIF
jgi:DNA (cytosine-5)-methyltransferase 1